MSRPFEIKFDFAVDNPDFIISIRATAELHHSDPYYVIDNFHIDGKKEDNPSVLPVQEICVEKRGNGLVWVHRDSRMETLLSRAIGKAIEKMPGFELP